MKLPAGVAGFLLALVCVCFLGACSSGPARSTGDPGVEDIQPGEKSIIQPPDTSGQPGGRHIEERAI